jgi:hypothetical protein
VSGSTSPRLAALGAADPAARALADRLLALAVRGLPSMYRQESAEYAFTRYGASHLRGVSHRYAAMVALGARFLPEPDQSAALSGQSSDKLTDTLIDRLPGITDLGDVAVIAWAAAEHRHPRLREALARLAAVDADPGPRPVVEASWVVSALAAARDQADVEEHLGRARDRILNSRHQGSPLFPHSTDKEHGPWYRRHVGCFADQVYPMQALARLHASGDDEQALAAADACAGRICELQGDAGQWWWHYDARTGGLVEGYPVYSVHQHAMAPMALFDVAEAGGTDRSVSVREGLMWMTETPELAGQDETMIQDAVGVTWRKVYRGDPRKAVRAVRGVTTSISPSLRLGVLDKVLTPHAVDKECRPYEFGWMFYAWHGALPGKPAAR